MRVTVVVCSRRTGCCDLPIFCGVGAKPRGASLHVSINGADASVSTRLGNDNAIIQYVFVGDSELISPTIEILIASDTVVRGNTATDMHSSGM